MGVPVHVIEELRVRGTARRPRGLVPWVTTAMVVVPLGGWVAIAATAGADALLIFLLLLALPVAALGMPFVLARAQRRRGTVRVLRVPGGVSFPATGADRVGYLVAAVGMVMLPFVGLWDLARTGDDSGNTRFAWAALALGLYGLKERRRWRRTKLVLTPSGLRLTRIEDEELRRGEALPPVDVLELYRTRPELRRELADGRVVERLRRGEHSPGPDTPS